jgi:opacity protein-like surface antigen
MIKKTNTRWAIAAVSLVVAGSLISTPALAKKRHKRHRHHSSESYSQSYSQSSEMNSKVDALEAQMRAMQDELSSLRANAGAGASSADAAKVQELDAWMQEAKSKPARSKDNMVFFRGGFARNDQRPHATTSNLNGDGCNISGLVDCNSSDKEGWYFGAGFDFSLDDDLFGMMDNTEVLAELAFDYNEFGTFTGNVTGAPGFGAPGGVPNSASTATQSQLRLTAAPKIKFFKGSKLRPWIIPAGFTLNVMSPPSQANTITHLMPAMHFGGGVDYNIWENIYVGADVRYNWAFNKLDSSVNTNGLTAGGYLGIGF